MKPRSVIPSRSSVYQLERKRRIAAEAGRTQHACEACGGQCYGRLSPTMVRFGCTRERVGFVAGRVCSATCAERMRAKGVRP